MVFLMTNRNYFMKAFDLNTLDLVKWISKSVKVALCRFAINHDVPLKVVLHGVLQNLIQGDPFLFFNQQTAFKVALNSFVKNRTEGSFLMFSH